MADFRRLFTVLAELAVMACAASAQVGVANGGANSALTCTATGAVIPELRPEGYTDLSGDILITCTGGPDLQQGATIPTANIVLYTTNGAAITSRLLASTGASEALLIIDEAGSNITSGVPGFGPQAPQTGCSTAQQQALGGSTCTAYVGMAPGVNSVGVPVNYAVAVTAPGGSTPAQNVYQGKLGDFGANSVTFYNVPVLPPATSGVSRVFRVTNVRVPTVGVPSGSTVVGFFSISPSQAIPLSNASVTFGVVGPATSMAVKPQSAFQQCVTASRALSANLIFTEGFATAFKTRVVPGGISNGAFGNAANITYAAEAQNLAPPINQNIPGGLYGGFASNSESGFISPLFTSSNTGSGAVNYTAGLADYGTRLKAVFYNIPAGITLYVSTTSGGTVPSSVGGTSVLPYAVLVATNSGEATPDGASFSPIASTALGGDGLGSIALSANSAGAAVAVWEVTNSNPSAQDVLTFSVYISYSATSATTANPYGLPITDLPLGALVNDVQLSFAPEPGGGTFSAAQGPTALATIVPRFAVIKTQEGRWTTVGLCQTTLLYPFVTAQSGFDTGIAVANTSWDPFGTVHQTGSCQLYGYGVTLGGATPVATQPVIPGCDGIANPVPGTNCFGGAGTSNVIPSGQVGSAMASSLFPGFTGYVIAVCNFQFAHGYAAVTDLGLRNLWSSYLALELNDGTVGTIRKGGQGVENLVH